MNTLHLNKEDIETASELLKQNQVVGFPTETVYGLGVVFDNEDAFERLQIAKNRPPHKPFTLMCGDVETIRKYAVVDERTEKVISEYMPGAITLLLPIKGNIPEWVTLGSQSIGVRISSHPYVLKLIKKVGKPLLVPSANKSGEAPLSLFKDVESKFDGDIAGIVEVDAGGELPSTIVAINDTITLVRQGSISFDEIRKTWEE